MARQNSLTISISPEAKAGLAKRAAELGYYWGPDKPNISALLEALGAGEIPIGDPSPARSLAKARQLAQELADELAD
jgi:hypothetical protein